MAQRQNLIFPSVPSAGAPWSKISCSITANATTSPPFDNTATASALLATDTTSVGHYCYPITEPAQTGVWQTYSIYAKAGAVNFISMLQDSTFNQAYFNLTTGAVNNISSGIFPGTASIQNMGSGWWRCSITCFRQHAANTLRCYFTNVNNSVTYAAADTVTAQAYIWGAQVTNSNWAGPYVATTGAAVSTGAIRSIVPLQQNLCFPSVPTSATWTKLNVTITANAVVAPDGTTTASAIIAADTVSEAHYIFMQNDPVPIGAWETWSVYAKAGAVNNISLLSDGTFAQAYFTLTGSGSTNVITGGGNDNAVATIQALANGWYRCSLSTFRLHPASSVRCYATATNSSTTYAASDSVTAQVYLWGAQVVNANWAGPYAVTTSATINQGAIRNIVDSQAQNLMVQSEDLTTTWTHNACTVATGALANPLTGATTACSVTDDNTNDVHYVRQSVAVTRGGVYTFSVYLKAGAGKQFVGVANDAVGVSVTFDLVNGEYTTPLGSLISTDYVSCGIDPVPGQAGWFRCWVASVQSNSASSVHEIFSAIALNEGPSTHHNGTSALMFYAFGMQVNAGVGPTPYVKTVASAVSNGPTRQLVARRQNQMRSSEDMTTGVWNGNFNGTVLGNQIANPLTGTVTAGSFTDNSSASVVHFAAQSAAPMVAGTLYTLSFYAKAGAGGNFISVPGDNESWFVSFDLLNGLMGSAFGSGTASFRSAGIVPVSGQAGWFRVWVTGYNNFQTNSDIRIYSASSLLQGGITYTGTSTVRFYAWGFQLSQTNGPIPYVGTGSSNVLVGEGPGPRQPLPQQENLLLQSQDFTQSFWTKNNCNMTGAMVVAPDGTTTAQPLIASTLTNVFKYFSSTEPLNINSLVTFSIYAKKGAVNFLNIELDNAHASVWFDLNAGSVGTISSGGSNGPMASIKAFGNGWYRCVVTTTRAFVATATGLQLVAANANNGGAYVAGDTTTAQLYLWGAQYELNNTPGPYAVTTTGLQTVGGTARRLAA